MVFINKNPELDDLTDDELLKHIKNEEDKTVLIEFLNHLRQRNSRELKNAEEHKTFDKVIKISEVKDNYDVCICVATPFDNNTLQQLSVAVIRTKILCEIQTRRLIEMVLLSCNSHS